MFDVMADWLTVPLLNTEAGQPPQHQGLQHPSIAPYGVFSCAGGGQILLAVQNDREWRALAQGQDAHFASDLARVQNRAQTDALVAAALSSLTLPQAEVALLRADLAFARVNDMAALSKHPQLRRITVATPAGPVSYPAPAARFAGENRRYGAVPGLRGQD